MSRLSSAMTRCLSRPVLSPQWSSSLLRRRFSVKAIYSSFPATLHYYSPRARSNLFDRGEIDSRLDYLIDDAVMVEKNGLVYPAVDAASGVSNGVVMLPNTFEMQEVVRGNLDEALDREAEMKQSETAFIYTIFKGMMFFSMATRCLRNRRKLRRNTHSDSFYSYQRVCFQILSPAISRDAFEREAPKELFRVNSGYQVKVRAWTPQRHVYDIVTQNGLVEPKALDPLNYAAPNGASMRPNSPYQQSLVSWRFRSNDIVIYGVPKGTSLPDDLLLAHERSDHYSLQPAKAMTLDGKLSCLD
ncbi:hypothetical protein AK830_g590 [Neonectria ditissima]|uniref:Tse2 ADP-ribosyltransferase toxin domain-containing protein n=1 Tax=Neonectria ditissima TaxID=78410 RepID=A0A0N8H8Y4_9HYPO|nr:hypothetical protein AK830_g590 [Neonectria ditissima]